MSFIHILLSEIHPAKIQWARERKAEIEAQE
jgi:hypothetical protein